MQWDVLHRPDFLRIITSGETDNGLEIPNASMTQCHANFTHIYIYIYTVTTFKYVEAGPDREAPAVV